MARKPSVDRIFQDKPSVIIINGKEIVLDKKAINKKKAEAILQNLTKKNGCGCNE